MDFLPWKYEISDVDNRINYNLNEALAFNPNYVVFYYVELNMDEYLEHEVSTEDVLTKILPFVCQKMDLKAGHLTIEARLSDDVLDIFKNESRIPFFVLYGHKDNVIPFLDHKLNTVQSIKLVLYRWYDNALMNKIEQKFLAGKLEYFIAEDVFIKAQLAINIINYFKQTLGKKKFYFEARQRFSLNKLKSHLKGLTMKTTNDFGDERKEYTLEGGSNKLTIINMQNTVAFMV
ncbi:hypothetical protein L596_021494 [Steinernema carpocapsae]|uniref:Uncharacterized protein n=1 Tax=Steinernema carpocapsae TaxID=34508 RepID=A0A4U5MIY8_STECR|nr:hypothetical protein L596_021494 [Steinernema carpocapsae]